MTSPVASVSGLPQLQSVASAFDTEVTQIEAIFASSDGSPSVNGYAIPYSPTEDGYLICLWDAWNRFIRALVLTSCLGACEGSSGAIYHPATPMNEKQALAHLAKNCKGTKIKMSPDGEPAWNNEWALNDLTAILGLANANTIVAGLTAYRVSLGPITVPSPLDELRKCRNFVAHKGPGTLGKVRSVAGPGFQDLRAHMRQLPYGSEVFSGWKDACVALAHAAAT